MTQIVLIHGGESTKPKLAAALPGADVTIVYRKGLSSVYDEKTGLAADYPTLRDMLAEYVPSWRPGEPLVVLAFSAGAWALRHYLRDPQARSDIDAAIFLDGTYGGSSGTCNLAPYDGVLAFGKLANSHPSRHRLIMTYGPTAGAPGVCAEAIAAKAPGPGVFVVPYSSGDHGSQQSVAGPAAVADLVAPWLRKGGDALVQVALAAALGLLVFGLVRWGRR